MKREWLRTVVYKINGDILFKRFRFSQHTLRKPPAIAVDFEVLQEAERQGCRWVQCFDEESNNYFTTPFENFHHGIRIERGHGLQIAVPLRLWHRSKSPEVPTTIKEQQNERTQLLL